MIEYKILESESASGLNRIVQGLASHGWMMSFYTASNAHSPYMHYKIFSCVMEKENND